MKKRYFVLDCVRGLALLSMVLYHAVWDLVYMFETDLSWYRSELGYLWQQSICWTFIFLSGFCWSLGKKKWSRGAMVFGAGLLVTVVTILFMPENRVVFGVLTLTGSCMLLMIPLERILRKCPALPGMSGALALFFVMRNINRGYLGFESVNLWKLPEGLYHGPLMTYLGFPEKSFFSTDYFSLIPWCFLFVSGYFMYRILKEREALKCLEPKTLQPLEWIGKHSLEIYLIHQPLIYLGLSMLD